ncbi:MAG: hypothetical protein EB100_00015 [Crocinitomicaceae bacterium]|jgi:hypothetical protein|nr:hypothetical protein [Crocinitomicaceae bacterium]
MIDIVKHSLRFFAFIFIQAFIFNQLEIGLGIQIMVYPLYIFLLPIELNVFALMFISFAFGISIDYFSNTFGLFASSALLIAYLRPFLFKFLEPRDGFLPGAELSIYQMGYGWFSTSFVLVLLINNFWFFLIEQFKWKELWYVILKTILSTPLSLGAALLFQMAFFKNTSSK